MKLTMISRNLLITLPILALGACSSTTNMDSESKIEQPIEKTIEPVMNNTVKTEVVKVEKILTEKELMVQKYGSAILETTINFDFNESTIESRFTPILLAHAAYLMDHAEKTVTIEGHTDERGTSEYNITLGERRAKEVATYLENIGVRSNQINVVSYGEEKPVNMLHINSAWTENRRAELVY